MRKLLQCEDCEASFEVKHDMDERYYNVSFCPFCASEITLEDELEDEVEDWED
jgi:hydrogenase maturation factor HypF (carbamoyltransferase family)